MDSFWRLPIYEILVSINFIFITHLPKSPKSLIFSLSFIQVLPQPVLNFYYKMFYDISLVEQVEL